MSHPNPNTFQELSSIEKKFLTLEYLKITIEYLKRLLENDDWQMSGEISDKFVEKDGNIEDQAIKIATRDLEIVALKKTIEYLKRLLEKDDQLTKDISDKIVEKNGKIKEQAKVLKRLSRDRSSDINTRKIMSLKRQIERQAKRIQFLETKLKEQEGGIENMEVIEDSEI